MREELNRIKPDFLKNRINSLDQMIEQIDVKIRETEGEIERRKEEYKKSGMVSNIDKEIRKARESKKAIGASESGYTNAKKIVEMGIFGGIVVASIGVMMSGISAIPLYSLFGFGTGSLFGVMATDDNSIWKGLKKLYLNYKQFIYRSIKEPVKNSREKKYYKLHSYYKMRDELNDLLDEKEILVNMRERAKSELEFYYKERSIGHRNVYRFTKGVQIDVNSSYNYDNDKKDAKVRRR